MALPELTQDQRAQALAKAAAARRARVVFKQRLTRGEVTVAQLCESAATDDVIGKTRVKEVLLALPKVGQTTANAIMTEVGIAPTRRLRGLTTRQRQALLDRCNRLS
jgi:hypothetical protein